MTASVERVITARPRDIGSFSVRRYLPHARRRLVGPFIFFDHMGPVDFEVGQGMDVRPHPHINLATVTYLFDGEIMHADSLGYHQPIHPGDVNWMTAGRGIVHSERTAPEVRARGQRLDGIQSWVALPTASEEVAPDFHHHPQATLPMIEQGGATMRLIAGEAFGERSPVAAYSPMVYLDAQAPAGAQIPVPDAAELAFYVVDGAVSLAGERYGPGTMVVLDGGGDAALAVGRVRPGDAARRRAARRAAAHLVELRLQQPGPDRAGQGRLARGPLSGGRGRRRVHPATGRVRGRGPTILRYVPLTRRSGRACPATAVPHSEEHHRPSSRAGRAATVSRDLSASSAPGRRSRSASRG